MIDRVPMPHNNPLLLAATGAPQRQQQQQQQHQNVDNVRSWLSKQAPAIQVRKKIFPSPGHSFAYGRGKRNY
jgi:hypothetical protein